MASWDWKDTLGAIGGPTVSGALGIDQAITGGQGANYLDNATGNVASNTLGAIGGGVGDYFMGPTNAAEAQEQAARDAVGYVGEGYSQGLGTMGGLADAGMQDYQTYRNQVQGGQYQTNPRSFETGGYNAPNRGQTPGFNPYQQGQAPGFQQYNRGQDPSFQRADAGNFNFDYQQSPGFQQQLDQTLGAIQGSHSGQGSRFSGGATKDAIDYASGAVSRDYAQDYNRQRGAFEQDRGFGERQAGQQNQFNQGNYQFGQGMDANQMAQQNQFSQNQYQFGTNVGVGQSDQANAYGNQNFWQGAGMDQANSQFGFNADLAANNQNYGMYNQQNQQQANMMAGLAGYGPQAQQNYANMQIGQGEALGNAALGLGNAQANSAMAMQNTVNPILNTAAQFGGAYLGAG